MVEPAHKLTLTPKELGNFFARQRNALGLSQGQIAKTLSYANANFISMIESGRSKIPIGRVDDFVSVYQLSPEFTFVAMQVLYPDFLETILKLSKRAPKIFKDTLKNTDEEIFGIYSNAEMKLKSAN